MAQEKSSDIKLTVFMGENAWGWKAGERAEKKNYPLSSFSFSDL